MTNTFREYAVNTKRKYFIITHTHIQPHTKSSYDFMLKKTPGNDSPLDANDPNYIETNQPYKSTNTEILTIK